MRTRNRRILSVIYLSILALSLAVAVLRPVSFQKSNSIVGFEANQGLPDVAGGQSLDVQRVVGGIPNNPDREEVMVWEVDPDAKYQRTVVEGQGNCSNLVFGLARYLGQSEIDFQIVHLMNPRKFLSGTGHTVVRTRFNYAGHDEVGIVDVYAGGLPRSGEAFLDLSAFGHGPIENLNFISWNGRPERAAPYYGEPPGQLVIGWISAEDVDKYFRFIQTVYVPLGSRRLEKYVFDGAAVLLGTYPSIHVWDVAPLRDPNRLLWTASRIGLWVFRSTIALVPLLAWLEWRDGRRKS